MKRFSKALLIFLLSYGSADAENMSRSIHFREWFFQHCSLVFSACHGTNKPDYADVVLTARQWTHSSKEKVQFADDEIVAIMSYTTGLYRPINAALRSHQGASISNFTDVLNGALAKLPNEQGMFYRYDNLPAAVLSQWIEGATVTLEGYTSTSAEEICVNASIAKKYDYCKNAHQIVLIHSQHGKRIENFSKDPDEHEVLILPGARFKIIKRVPTPNGLIGLLLEEVEPKSDS